MGISKTRSAFSSCTYKVKLNRATSMPSTSV